MKRVLNYIDLYPEKQYVLVFDDLKRFARNTRFHLELRQELRARSCDVMSPNFKFDNTPEGEFIETIIAAQNELERKQNRRQVCQKMKARLEQGFWCFDRPLGYRYQKATSGGKVLTPEPESIYMIKE